MNSLLIRLLSLSLSLSLLQGCGGGGGSDGSTSSGGTSYTGSTSEANIDSTNAKDIATGAASGSQQAVVSDSLSGVAMRAQVNPAAKLAEVAPRIAQWINRQRTPLAAKTVDVSGDICDAGGRAVANTNDAETEGTINFTDCAMSDMRGGTLVLDGIVEFTVNVGADTLSMVFHVTVSYIGETETIDLALDCSSISTAAVSCSMTSDFAGIDGRVYRIDDISVSGNEVSGFYINMTLYDPDHGWVVVTTGQPLTYGCANEVPGSGMLTLNGGNGSFATASFDSCSSFTITLDGVGATYNW
ncbi:MAG: hypothetical protein AB2598_12780 [Candidatus Thiodiazotropha sp.]